MTTLHTREPWTLHEQGDANQYYVLDADGRWVLGLIHNGEMLVERQRATLARMVDCINACAGIANLPEDGLKAAMLDSALAWATVKQERDILETALRKICQQPFTPSTNGERWDEGFEKGWRAAMDGAYSIVRRALEEATK